MRTLDIFSGIGGFSLGLERAGIETIAFCELDPFARLVLAKHWPEVPVYDDVRTLKGDDIGAIEIICGGFPCQDISTSGQKSGIQGERSSLWGEYARLIGELRPRYAIVENVAALLYRGIDVVLADLAEIGYDAEWHCIPACAVGADHRRDRVWIVAYPEGERRGSILQESGLFQEAVQRSTRLAGDRRTFYAADAKRVLRETEPGLDRVADGIPDRIHRCKGVGNAVYPDIPEIIGRAIMAAEGL